MTKLVEFLNNTDDKLRGLYDTANSGSAVIFIHGFERTTVETKFKRFVDELRGQHSLLRFDLSGCGLSDGDFTNFSVSRSVDDLSSAIRTLKQINPTVNTVSLVAHSLGCCIALQYLSKQQEPQIHRMVFLAPALNQKELHRYWFVQSSNPNKDISWSNYRNFLNELEFEDYCRQPLRITKEHYLSNTYFLENKDKDYQDLFSSGLAAKAMVIYSQQDTKVPPGSNNHLPVGAALIILDQGDHDLQSPPVVGQYLDRSVSFLNEK